MLRIQKLGIKCPVCDKPDGCLIADDGSACICARIQKGSVKKVGKPFVGGYLHILGDFKPLRYVVPPKKKVDWNKWTVKFAKQLINNREAFGKLCQSIGLNPISALRFYIGWHKGWLTVPVYSMMRKVSGIQRRQGSTKRYMKHSGMGVFVPSAFFQNPSNTLAVCEGWTDTVAALEYGYNAIGKVNAYVGNEEVVMYVKTHPTIQRVIVFADNDQDGVGLAGAVETEELLVEEDFTTKVVLTPEKDLRACKQKGMTIQEVING